MNIFNGYALIAVGKKLICDVAGVDISEFDNINEIFEQIEAEKMEASR